MQTVLIVLAIAVLAWAADQHRFVKGWKVDEHKHGRIRRNANQPGLQATAGSRLPDDGNG
ncbi:hypothetical protein QF001_000517 [Paraburkholderia youngii]